MNPGKSTKFIEHDDEIKSYIQQITDRRTVADIEKQLDREERGIDEVSVT